MFADFIQSPPSPPPMVRTFPGPPRTPSPPLRPPSPPLPPPPSRSPSPDILLELYQHSRHPVDDRSHLTIIPSWSQKADKEERGMHHLLWRERTPADPMSKLWDNESVLHLCSMCASKHQFLPDVSIPGGVLEPSSPPVQKSQAG